MNYYISDYHINHSNILWIDKRKFSNIDEMNKHIINQWNSKVTDTDDVYVLGDFIWGGNIQPVLNKLKGKKHIILGNHDRGFIKNTGIKGIESIDKYLEIEDCGKRIILSHYPIVCYNGQFRGTYMFYGHVHFTDDYVMIEKYKKMVRNFKRRDGVYAPIKMVNCFCMASDYIPLSADEWIHMEESGEINKVAANYNINMISEDLVKV